MLIRDSSRDNEQNTKHTTDHRPEERIRKLSTSLNDTMADPDIPLAYATMAYPIDPKASPPPLAPHGRSSRVVMPKQKSRVMQESEIRALKEQGFTTGMYPVVCGEASYINQSIVS